MSRSSPSASPDAPAEEARAAAPEAEPPVAWASQAPHGDVVVDDDGVVVVEPRAVEQVRTVTVSTLTRVHGAEFEQRALRSARRQETNEHRLQQRRSPDACGEADNDAVTRSGREEAHEDEEGSSRQSLLLFVVATAILVICMVAGFISIALLEQIERRKKRASIDTPDFD
ncbi:hypothetical protein HPB50_013998 [Hyalomma asiaticum]|uniref:Uncharacterized protein n=1 Tax=Hyalomma asiaticum TaxID=266040 RepID=A0ACB7SFA2_HYAAI|nr:hypothetical protein HPB50_013998 [Hyalomma asiaticum]